MNERKLVHNFKSYLGLEDSSLKINNEATAPLEELKPKLLAGEIVIGVAHRVVLYAPVSEKQRGRFGSLFVTNYKLSFVTSDEQAMGGCHQQSRVLGPHDVPLSLVGGVMELAGGEDGRGTRRRPLRPARPLPRRVPGLQVLCKNMRVLSFGFKFSPEGQGRAVAAALLHHAFPRRHHLLFAYECREPYSPPNPSDLNMFQKASDWKREMDRTNCRNWRISQANGTVDGFCNGTGEFLVVPSSVVDCQLAEAARHFRKGRVPVWVWSAPGGAVLARSGELAAVHNGHAGTPAHAPESVLLEATRRAHPSKTAPQLLALAAPALRPAHKRLTHLCTPNTLNDFWEQDSQFYSALESTRWLRYVSECLALAAQAAQLLSDNVTVVLQEGDGMDYCAVVSSLTQLLVDSHCRTIKGFQSLIQKEWVALGHPFSDRLGHVALEETEAETEREMSPVLLLFLDCCWQLLQQFPGAFQFTGVYLTTLWDSAHNQLFETFLFNSPRERELAAIKGVSLRPVWDWQEQFSEEETQLFYNPLYSPPAQPTHPVKSVIPASAIRLPGLASPAKGAPLVTPLPPSPSRLQPLTALPGLQLWRQCYLRWLPPLQLPVSGDAQFLLHNLHLSRQIDQLKRELGEKRSNGATPPSPPACPHPQTVGAYFPFAGPPCGPPLPGPEVELDTQSVLDGAE